MQGDKVFVKVEGEEKEGQPVFAVEISEKPQFMMDEEFNLQLIECATYAVQSVCKTCFPNNEPMQGALANTIAKKAVKKLG